MKSMACGVPHALSLYQVNVGEKVKNGAICWTNATNVFISFFVSRLGTYCLRISIKVSENVWPFEK